MTTGGVFLHNCEAGNKIGTTMSRNISVFVNSKYGAFWSLKKRISKQMKALGLVLSSVSRCLEPVMKHEARVFDMSSQMKQ